MSEINLPQNTGKRKVHAPRIDLTPMVDLGFLLITFFIFTTTMANPRTMEVNMPFKPSDATTAFVDTSTITLIPVKDHAIAYYNGQFENTSTPQTADFKEIREILIEKQNDIKALPASFSEQAQKLHVIIKPNDDCTYEDVVDVLDEMSILDVPYYAIDDITAREKEWLKNQ